MTSVGLGTDQASLSRATTRPAAPYWNPAFLKEAPTVLYGDEIPRNSVQRGQAKVLSYDESGIATITTMAANAVPAFASPIETMASGFSSTDYVASSTPGCYSQYLCVAGASVAEQVFYDAVFYSRTEADRTVAWLMVQSDTYEEMIQPHALIFSHSLTNYNDSFAGIYWTYFGTYEPGIDTYYRYILDSKHRVYHYDNTWPTGIIDTGIFETQAFIVI